MRNARIAVIISPNLWCRDHHSAPRLCRPAWRSSGVQGLTRLGHSLIYRGVVYSKDAQIFALDPAAQALSRRLLEARTTL